jgi:hypothetical protein
MFGPSARRAASTGDKQTMVRFRVFMAEASYFDGLNRSVRLARRLFRIDFFGPPLR